MSQRTLRNVPCVGCSWTGRFLGVGLVLAALVHLSAAQSGDFFTWLQGVRNEALQQGIRSETLDLALADIRPIQRVLDLDRRQPEGTITYEQYFARALSGARVQKGLRLLQEHRGILARISQTYGVLPEVIVALWGIETDFGQVTGNFPVLSSLATLAYDGRRSAFFRSELLKALQIVDAGHVRPEAMRGSWAGAMGQNQFMPSSFLQFAVDDNGDGRRDIWSTRADVFASTANYLARSGWRSLETWGHRVLLPPGFVATAVDGSMAQSLGTWHAMGVQWLEGDLFPSWDTQASLVLPSGLGGPSFLVYPNYQIFLKWNRSTFFALTVGQFVDQLRGK